MKTKTSNPAIFQLTGKDERFYEVKGIYLPAVTWILNSYPKGIGFYKWLASEGWNEAQAIKDTAGDRGSKVHNAIQDLLKGRQVKKEDRYWSELNSAFELLTIEEWKALLTFQKFWEDKKPKLIATERVCYSDKFKYAGTIDAIIILDGQVTIADWKTSSKIYPTYPMQVAAYLNAESETGEFKAKQTAIVRLNTLHKSRYELKTFGMDEIAEHFNQFRDVKGVWSVKNKDKAPDLVELPGQIKIKIEKVKRAKQTNTRKTNKRDPGKNRNINR